MNHLKLTAAFLIAGALFTTVRAVNRANDTIAHSIPSTEEQIANWVIEPQLPTPDILKTDFPEDAERCRVVMVDRLFQPGDTVTDIKVLYDFSFSPILNKYFAITVYWSNEGALYAPTEGYKNIANDYFPELPPPFFHREYGYAASDLPARNGILIARCHSFAYNIPTSTPLALSMRITIHAMVNGQPVAKTWNQPSITALAVGEKPYVDEETFIRATKLFSEYSVALHNNGEITIMHGI